MYVDWVLQSSVTDDQLARVLEWLGPEECESCAWRGEDARTVKVSFDVTAEGYEEAGVQARQRMSGLVDVGLPGRIGKIVACTENGQFQWGETKN